MTSSLGDRIEWAARHARLSLRALSIQAGLAPGTAHAVVTLSRSDPNYRPNLRTLESLGRVAKCSPEWLATGRGSPDDVAARTSKASTRAVPAPRTLADHAWYAEVEREARRIATVSAEVWAHVRDMPLTVPVRPSPAALASLAVGVAGLGPTPAAGRPEDAAGAAGEALRARVVGRR